MVGRFPEAVRAGLMRGRRLPFAKADYGPDQVLREYSCMGFGWLGFFREMSLSNFSEEETYMLSLNEIDLNEVEFDGETNKWTSV